MTTIGTRGAVAALALLLTGATARAQDAGAEAIPAARLRSTLGNTPAMDAWQGRTLRVSGFFGGAGSEYVTVNSMADVIDHIVDCTTNGADPRVAALTRGQPVVVVGQVSRIFHGFTGHFQLAPCTVAASAPVAAEPPRAAAPADPPLGEYAVYQGAGFSYQYRFALQPGGRYLHAGSDAGRYAYDARTKVLRFTSGPLQGFVGLYYTRGRNNDRNEPAIALDAEGRVPDLANASNGQYQYAYFRPGGVK